MIHADTHAVAWLHAGEVRRVPPRVLRRLERSAICVSPAVELELQLRFEIGRIRHPVRAVIRDLAQSVDLRLAATPFEAIIAAASAQGWTRDPFDRIIDGHAQADRATLLTADESIRRHCRFARWG